MACLGFTTSYCGDLQKRIKTCFFGGKNGVKKKQLLVLVYEIKKAKSFKEEKIVVGLET